MTAEKSGKSNPAVYWAWLTAGGDLAHCPSESWARHYAGRGCCALVKITLKRRRERG